MINGFQLLNNVRKNLILDVEEVLDPDLWSYWTVYDAV